MERYITQILIAYPLIGMFLAGLRYSLWAERMSPDLAVLLVLFNWAIWPAVLAADAGFSLHLRMEVDQ